jgi:hypothetical protein
MPWWGLFFALLLGGITRVLVFLLIFRRLYLDEKAS